MAVTLLFFLLLSFVDVTRSVSLDEFYPFGNSSGDTAMARNDDGSSPDIFISTQYPYFNHQHNKLIVNTNGAISFLATLSQYTPHPFPLGGDRRLITAYWGDVDTRNGGSVWFRESTEKLILKKASSEIRNFMPQFPRFTATWVFIATWDNVAFYGADSVGRLRRNTFQTILVSNGRNSFAIFLYNKMQWTTGTASHGSSSTGLGGTPAQVGFNAGDGKIYYAVNASRTSDIINITDMSNINSPGKFVFRVDSAEIHTGGCSEKQGRLTIMPWFGPMLGGQLITIGGPCIETGDKITITYEGADIQEYMCQRKTDFSATCTTPMFFKTGEIGVQVRIKRAHRERSIDVFEGRYTINNPAYTTPSVLRNDSSPWTIGNTYQISWNPDEKELDSKRVKIEIHTLQFQKGGFHWAKTSHGDTKNKSDRKAQIHFNIHAEIAAIKVVPDGQITHNKSFLEKGIWSDIFLANSSNPNKSKSICQTFFRMEYRTKDERSLRNGQPCPCTLAQALLDTARFSPDPECSLIGRNVVKRNCVYRQDSQHCIRSNNQGRFGSENVCCYDQKGMLIDSRNKEGGFVQKYHYMGGPDNVPYLSNLYFDTRPFLHCCRNSTASYDKINGTMRLTSICGSFFNFRSPSDCQNYMPPRPARISGDPHLTTLDGLNYTFNGVGEYLLAEDDNHTFSTQIRFEQFVNDNDQPVPASVTTSVSMIHYNISDKIEVRLNPIRIADVIVNDNQVELDEEVLNFLHYKDVSVLYTTTKTSDGRKMRDIVVTFPSLMMSVRLQASEKVMNVMPVIANEKFKGHLMGLLGNFDGDPLNDLRDPEGRLISASESLENIHENFGEMWRISEERSIFTYPPGKPFDMIQNLNFRPIFDVNISDRMFRECGSDLDCAYDLKLTDSKEVVQDSQIFLEDYREALEAADEVHKTCALLPGLDTSAWWIMSDTQMEGSEAKLVCGDGYVQSKNFNTHCRNDNWTPSVQNLVLDEYCQKNLQNAAAEVNKTSRGAILSTTITNTEVPGISAGLHSTASVQRLAVTKQKSKLTTKMFASARPPQYPEISGSIPITSQPKSRTSTDAASSKSVPTSILSFRSDLRDKATRLKITSSPTKEEAAPRTFNNLDNANALRELDRKIQMMWTTLGGGILLVLVVLSLHCIITRRGKRSTVMTKERDDDAFSYSSSSGSWWRRDLSNDNLLAEKPHQRYSETNNYPRGYSDDGRQSTGIPQLARQHTMESQRSGGGHYIHGTSANIEQKPQTSFFYRRGTPC